MSLKSFFNHIFVTALGLAIAGLFGFFMWLELKDGVAAAHTTHIVLDTVMIAIGCLVAAPTAFGGAAKKLTVILVDAKKGGLRWTVKTTDEHPSIEVKQGKDV